MVEEKVTYDIHSDHPWALLPMLVDAKIITAVEAHDDIIFAQSSVLRKGFREMNSLLNVLFENEDITARGLERLQRVLVNAQADSTPDY
jgi:hypothetical protein